MYPQSFWIGSPRSPWLSWHCLEGRDSPGPLLATHQSPWSWHDLYYLRPAFPVMNSIYLVLGLRVITPFLEVYLSALRSSLIHAAASGLWWEVSLLPSVLSEFIQLLPPRNSPVPIHHTAITSPKLASNRHHSVWVAIKGIYSSTVFQPQHSIQMIHILGEKNQILLHVSQATNPDFPMNRKSSELPAFLHPEHPSWHKLSHFNILIITLDPGQPIPYRIPKHPLVCKT